MALRSTMHKQIDPADIQMEVCKILTVLLLEVKIQREYFASMLIFIKLMISKHDVYLGNLRYSNIRKVSFGSKYHTSAVIINTIKGLFDFCQKIIWISAFDTNFFI